jgi:hypothetical protein
LEPLLEEAEGNDHVQAKLISVRQKVDDRIVHKDLERNIKAITELYNRNKEDKAIAKYFVKTIIYSTMKDSVNDQKH